MWLRACLTSLSASCNPSTPGEVAEFAGALAVTGAAWVGFLLLLEWASDRFL